MSEDQSGDVHLLLFVLHYRDSFPVVPYGDDVRLPNRPKSQTIDKKICTMFCLKKKKKIACSTFYLNYR